MRIALTLAAMAVCLCGVFPFLSLAAERPAIVELEVHPPRMELAHVRDARRVIVSGKTADGTRYDLSAEAKLAPAGDGDLIRIDGDGFVVPLKVGETALEVSAAGRTVRLPVVVRDVSEKPVSFVDEVQPILGKVGCNAGTCHGSQQGQGGFQLSLRGYDAEFDYRALVDDVAGRRFNRSRPEQSLMLLKPTQGVPHEGGFLFDEESRAYAVIRQWIAEGCRYESVPRPESIGVHPEQPVLASPGDVQQLLVIAHYPDGATRDVTREAVFDTTSFEVATVDQSGLMRAVRRGQAGALVRYEGHYAVAQATIIGAREGFVWKDQPEANFIDEHVHSKLQRTKILPSETCTDAEFLRRIHLDLTGNPPTAADVRAFLVDERDSQSKRLAKIDELLDGPGYVDYWSLKWSDLLLANRRLMSEKGMWAFRNWIRNALATNRPYDEFVRELLIANGSTWENPAANYFRTAEKPNEVMANMTQVFLGTRFQCNECHDHPFERWTQTQYYELAAFFGDVGRKDGAEKGEQIIYTLAKPQTVAHVGTGQRAAPKFPFEVPGHAVDPDASALRPQLAAWLVAPENPYFARSLVNRYWSYFLGKGIIEPVDDLRANNPPTNPELLDALTADFVEYEFDLKRLVRLIVTSQAYQRSVETNEWNADDADHFSHALPRRLGAEQLFDAIMLATGAPPNIPGVPADFRAVHLPDAQVQLAFLDMFGRPPRETPCECERTSDVSLKQTLTMINGPTVSNAIIHPQGLVARLARENASPERIVEEVYLAALCRMPTDDESARNVAYIGEVGDAQEAAQDLLWALINSPAFLFNR
ncbi:MAG: DUF1549 domain-containing protein [Planctomycetaceae bacterium]